jgi:hypothetical protein
LAERRKLFLKISKWRRFAEAPLRFGAVAGTTATRERHAIRAKKFSGDFKNFKTAAAFAGDVLDLLLGCRIHALPKLSAIAIALRMAMDLLTVS